MLTGTKPSSQPAHRKWQKEEKRERGTWLLRNKYLLIFYSSISSSLSCLLYLFSSLLSYFLSSTACWNKWLLWYSAWFSLILRVSPSFQTSKSICCHGASQSSLRSLVKTQASHCFLSQLLGFIPVSTDFCHQMNTENWKQNVNFTKRFEKNLGAQTVLLE